jgi:energy-coupling factor transporter ATP-binding protein EcfA2
MKKIKSIKVKGSNFFKDNLEVEFSDKLNCIMGSRGTGKSTLLYFIKSIVSEEGEEDKTTFSILKNNLGQGTIELGFEDHEGKEYRIEKSMYDEPQPYLMPSRNHISISKIRNNLKCDIYEALAIEKIGLDSHSRLELIDKMVLEKEEIMYKIRNIQDDLKQNSIDLRSETLRSKKLKEKLGTYESAEEDLENHKKKLPPEVTQKDNDVFKREEANEIIRREEKKFIKEILLSLDSTDGSFDELIEDLSEKINEASSKGFLNRDILEEIATKIKNYYNKAISDFKTLRKDLKEITTKINSKHNELLAIHEKQHNQYVQLKQKFEKNKTYYDEYERLSKKFQEKNDLIKEVDKLSKKVIKYRDQRKKLLKNLNFEQNTLFKIRFEKIKELNKFLNGEVIITLTEGGIIDEYNERLKLALRGSKMKYSIIGPKLTNGFTPSELADVINNQNFERLKDIFGVDKERSQALIDALIETEELYEIEILYCPDLPEIKLRVDKLDDKTKVEQVDYRRTEDLSTGQRCTAILPIVFAVSDNPLIIDQPEDNLDNRYITETIHNIIRNKKNKRQLIFITHNPNIPVLSDAEFNMFLTFENQKAFINKTDGRGRVDDVKNNILKLLEGGEEAFKIRREKYGNLLT